MTQDEINVLMSQSGEPDSMPPTDAPEAKVEVQNADFESFSTNANSTGRQERNFDLLMDLTLPVSIELGRTNMFIKDILELGRGSIVEFDKLASEPVDVLINGKKMAEGEVVVIDKHFGIRITSLIDPSDRIKGLRK